MHGWEDYSCPEFGVILEHIKKYDMTLNLHTINHIEIMKECDNVYLDMSGTGIIR